MDLNFSIGRIILLTYIIIASSYCSNLFSNSLKKAIESNRAVQHLILIIFIMSLMIIFGNPFVVEITNNQQINIVIMSLLVYVWFIMTTKLDITWNICILILLTIYFLFESKKISDYNIMINDNNLDKIIKKEIIDSYIQMQNYLLITLFGITTIGTLFYANEKYEQYSQNGGFSLTKFIFN